MAANGRHRYRGFTIELCTIEVCTTVSSAPVSALLAHRLCAYPVVTIPKPNKITNVHNKSGLRRIDVAPLQAIKESTERYSGVPSNSIGLKFARILGQAW